MVLDVVSSERMCVHVVMVLIVQDRTVSCIDIYCLSTRSVISCGCRTWVVYFWGGVYLFLTLIRLSLSHWYLTSILQLFYFFNMRNYHHHYYYCSHTDERAWFHNTFLTLGNGPHVSQISNAFILKSFSTYGSAPFSRRIFTISTSPLLAA